MAKRGAGAAVLDLLYPRQCPLCNRVHTFGQSGACEDCNKKLRWIQEPSCMKCGKPLADDCQEYCGDCQKQPKKYERGYPALEYEEPLKQALYGFKYQNRRSDAGFFADCILKQYESQLKKLTVDGIVPVPVHQRKLRQRGYNQAELLAQELGAVLECPIYSDYLIRTIYTNPQKELNDKQRLKNLKNAFKIKENTIKLRKVLLVDDIYTSGATIESCTEVLLAAGTEQVYYTCVAIGRGYAT